ncbi:DUF2607 family protein [Vibrio sp. MACH09]|uniref:DUF2607 family protein n=1 Tax=Vibrio sp. MACH09 TaxID=3025122 RepID=UPI00295F40C6|nr:DUF2607 family protein [Vibrio sp. MACH09]
MTSRQFLFLNGSVILMKLSAHQTHSTQSRMFAFALAIVLWASFAYVEHQVDFDHSHHQQHQCELYAAVGNGLSFVPVTLPLVPQQTTAYSTTSMQRTERSIPTQKARAPPLLSLIS